MQRFLTAAGLAVLVLRAAPVTAGAVPAHACNGADPSLVSVTQSGTNSSGGNNIYTIRATVVNHGAKADTSNVLQFVDMYENGIRLDAKSIPPLRPEQSFSVTFNYQRSTDAGSGTSHLVFQIRMRNPAGNSMNCITSDDRAEITI